MKTYLPLILFLGGCTLMESLGLSTVDGEPTDVATGLSGMVGGLTGIDVLALWKTGEALFTKRGRSNLKNIGSLQTGFLSSLKSMLAVLAGAASPVEAQKVIEAVK
jgi:hypothetical protein